MSKRYCSLLPASFRHFFTALVLLACSGFSSAIAALEPNAAFEKHVNNLAQELRCLVCQNQTIADSQAPLALDLKNQVREKLAQGAADSEVIDFMVQRYGDFVLYRPPVKNTTWVLWFGPFLLLLLGLIGLFVKLRQQATPTEAHTPAALAQAAALLAHVDVQHSDKYFLSDTP
ncbi:MAG: cytochrome c-type biogenesis protein [Pseudomonadota bacterium]